MRSDDSRNKTRRFYDRISPVYDLIADSSEHEARELGVRLLAPTPGQTVLEIGCGTGHGLSLAKAVGQNGRVYGIDVSAGMLAVAHRHVMAAGVTHVHLAISDARSLCFPSSAFDAIFISFTLGLFESAIPHVLAEVRRVLTPTGRVGVVALAERAHHVSITFGVGRAGVGGW
jgi:demethylmenaquinone methyltransferase/2-methoxy-6-polyprenyl-1,4-benzoquinol methylase